MDSSVFFKLVRVVNLTARPFSESIGKAHRLSLNEWRVLLVLANHRGVAASEVDGADRPRQDEREPRASPRLVRHGRVVRKVDAADKRRMLLRLSAEGERLYERIGTPAKVRERHLFRGIAAHEQAQLGKMLDRLIENLVAADAGGG